MAGSAYNFAKALGLKPSQESIEKEYNRLYRNLVRSVRGYTKRGISTAFFKLPEKPMNITEGSIRSLQKKVVEWKYYTGKTLTPDKQKLLPKDITRSFTHNLKELSRIQRSKSKLSDEIRDAIIKNREELENRLEEKNKENPDYIKMKEEGISYQRIPDSTTNKALQLYQMADEAYAEATRRLAERDSSRNWYFVQLKAEESLRSFNDAGIKDFSRLFSFKVSHSGRDWSDIVDTFDTALYDSHQLDEDHRFTDIMHALTGDPRNLTAAERREYDDILHDLGLT